MGLMNIKEAARYLAISKRSMERLIEKDEVIIVRLPGIRKNLFRAEDLDLLAKEGRIVPASVPTFGHIKAANGGNRRGR